MLVAYSADMGRVIVVGSINVDFTVRVASLPGPGETVVGGTFQRSGGGKGANQAVAAARAGAEVILIGAVGADDVGAAALEELRSEGIDTSRCLRLPGVATGVALIVVDASGNNQIAVASGANAALDGASVAAALSGWEASPADVLLTGFEIGTDAVEAAIDWTRDHDVSAWLLNPAPARPIPRSITEARPILTPNEHESAELTAESDPERAARALHAETDAPVIVTLGPKGALLVDAGGHATRIPALPVQAVDATGAGDALNGILAAELAAGVSLEQALRRAVVGASLSTTRAGARAVMPTRQEIDRALEPSASR